MGVRGHICFHFPDNVSLIAPYANKMNEECWKKVTQDLIKLFPRPYCSILQTQFEVLKTMVAGEEVNESNFVSKRALRFLLHIPFWKPKW